MAGIHNRMPVLLLPENFVEWMDPVNQDSARLQHLLLPCDPGVLAAYAVGPVRVKVLNCSLRLSDPGPGRLPWIVVVPMTTPANVYVAVDTGFSLRFDIR